LSGIESVVSQRPVTVSGKGISVGIFLSPAKIIRDHFTIRNGNRSAVENTDFLKLQAEKSTGFSRENRIDLPYFSAESVVVFMDQQ
jgi:hypothetical protein